MSSFANEENCGVASWGCKPEEENPGFVGVKTSLNLLFYYEQRDKCIDFAIIWANFIQTHHFPRKYSK